MEVIFLDAVTNSRIPGSTGLSDTNWRLAYELTRLGIDVSVMGLYEKNAAPPYPNVNFIKINPPKNKYQNILTILCQRAILALKAKQVQNEKAVFHVSDNYSAGFLSLMGLGHRTVWQGHSNVLHNSRFGNPWDRSTYLSLRFFLKQAARSIRHVIALGPSLVYWWKKSGFRSDSIVVIPNGIDPDENMNRVKTINLPRGWITKENKILYVGRLSRDKGGYIELLNCLQNLNRIHSNSALLIVGDGPQREEIEIFSQFHNNPNSVFFLGNQPKSVVLSIYPRSDLLILPSINEMMPRVMLEAWACGTAFMGTNVGAIGDYLIDGQNGYLLSNLGQKYLEQRVKDALEDHQMRKRIVEKGRRDVRNFCWSIIAKEYQQLYSSI